jgi:hypothetical protein
VGIFAVSCDYLDVVPDNVATIDNAFKNRTEAQKFLYGCFGFCPFPGGVDSNPAMLGADEIWANMNYDSYFFRMLNIPMGNQNTSEPLANSYDQLWIGISDCNIFMENIHLPYDLKEEDRIRWIAEAKFFKAYYYFWMFRMYGPIPILKQNIPIDSKVESHPFRQPVDDVVDYIVSLLDEAVADLPVYIENLTGELGRPTKPIALALKAQTLTLAASPLFNCNEDYADYVDQRGVQLFPQDKSQEKAKWRKAADALKAAIDMALQANHELFDFHSSIYASKLSEQTILTMQVRGAVTERFNREIIWADSRSEGRNALLQRNCLPRFDLNQTNGQAGLLLYAPTLQIVEQFYTKNGVPIEEDKDWAGVNPMGLRTAMEADKQYIKVGYETCNLHFDREARFYGAITFDGGTFYGNQKLENDNSTNLHEMFETEMKFDQLNGYNSFRTGSPTGYTCKKLLSIFTSVYNSTNYIASYQYAFPFIRLADVYLMYAEALNECKEAPDAEVYEYIDLVRARTGLDGVVDSWHNHALNPNKPLTKEGMRDIIHRERFNELAFEGIRYWDLRRWKLGETYLTRPVRGLIVEGETAQEFYQMKEIFTLRFDKKKDYFSPISSGTLLKNPNLLQSPGWSRNK